MLCRFYVIFTNFFRRAVDAADQNSRVGLGGQTSMNDVSNPSAIDLDDDMDEVDTALKDDAVINLQDIVTKSVPLAVFGNMKKAAQEEEDAIEEPPKKLGALERLKKANK